MKKLQKKPYKHTAKVWEYRPNVEDTLRKNIFDSQGYTPDFIRYVALHYIDAANIEVTFRKPTTLGRLIIVTAPISTWQQAKLEYNTLPK